MTKEDVLKEKLKVCLANDFLIESDVPGKNLVEGVAVVIDHLLYPKKHVLEYGFDPCYVGVEVKYIDEPSDPHVADHSHSLGSISRLFWQAITYQQSVFEVDDKMVRPQFVLTYSTIPRYMVEKRTELGGEVTATFLYPSFFHHYLRLANRGMVGWLQLIDTKNWSMEFVGGTYFGRNSRSYWKPNTKVGQGIYVGNSEEKLERKQMQGRVSRNGALMADKINVPRRAVQVNLFDQEIDSGTL